MLSAAPESEIAALKVYGHNLGMAFQIADDILDFTADSDQLGKPVGSDLRQGTFTLPVFYFIDQDARGGSDCRLSQRGHGCFGRCDPQLAGHRGFQGRGEAIRPDRGRDALAVFPDNAYRRGLIDLANYVVDRSL